MSECETGIDIVPFCIIGINVISVCVATTDVMLFMLFCVIGIVVDSVFLEVNDVISVFVLWSVLHEICAEAPLVKTSADAISDGTELVDVITLSVNNKK